MTEWIATPAELDDLDLLLHGAYRPLTGFLDAAAAASVTGSGALPDGTAWPVPITLTVPDSLGVSAGDILTLLDEQRTPVAEVDVRAVEPAGSGTAPTGLRRPADDGPPDATPGRGPAGRHGGTCTVAGPVRALHRRERPDGIRLPTPGATAPTLGVPLVSPPHTPDLAAIAAAAGSAGVGVTLLALVGNGSPRSVDGAALHRACEGARDELARLGVAADVVAVPLPRHDAPEGSNRALAGRVAVALGVSHLPDGWGAGAAGVESVALPEVVLDRGTGTWAPTDRVPAERRDAPAAADVPERVADLVARGEPVPPELAPESTSRELRRAGGTVAGGVTVLFSGLSGSGKSTIANAVHAALLARTGRTVTLLDGDVVRTMLSSELGFSRAHRELNVRRIGYVAAEVTRHGGVALCAPIAPYASVRAEVRSMVEEHGRFVLVHVSTPLEVCEARDRKGLYAKARRGEIAEFTGVSDPYETPLDAELVIDGSRVPVEEAVDRVLGVIGRGYLAGGA